MKGWVVVKKNTEQNALESVVMNCQSITLYLSEWTAKKWFDGCIADSRKKDYEIVEVEIMDVL